jgi:hypothetical protein
VATLTRLLTDTTLTSAAEEVRDEMVSMPSPAELVPLIAGLLDGRSESGPS